MSNAPMWIFFDDVTREYLNYYGQNAENILTMDLEKYLSSFSENSEITILTRDVKKVSNWFKDKNLIKYVHVIKNPEY